MPGLSRDEIINLIKRMNSGVDVTTGYKLENRRVVETRLGGYDNPTMLIYIDEDVFDRIIDSDDPSAEALAALKGGEITVKGMTLGKKIKFFFLKIFCKCLRITKAWRIPKAETSFGFVDKEISCPSSRYMFCVSHFANISS